MKTMKTNIIVHHTEDNSICRLDHGSSYSIPAHVISGICAYYVGTLLKMASLDGEELGSFVREQESCYPKLFDGAVGKLSELGYVHRFNIDGRTHYVVNLTPVPYDETLEKFTNGNGGEL